MTKFIFSPLLAASITDDRGRVASATPTIVRMLVICISVAHLLGAWPAHAQYAETARAFAALDGGSSAAAQIDRRLFVAGSFGRVGPPTGGAVVVDPTGTHLPGTFPFFDGTVHEILADGYGGWVVVGAFTRVNGQPFSSFARVKPDRTVDPRYRITTDGAIRRVRIAHGRVYLLGDFTAINGIRRLGLAALDAVTGNLSSWGAGFDPGVDSLTRQRRTLRDLSVSSIGVYVSAGELRVPASASAGRLWGFEAASGACLFERDAFVTAIAATPTRVYVGSWGIHRLLWAVDALTGADVPWSVGLTFVPQGSHELSVTSLLLDGARLYLGGFFATTDNRRNVAAVDAATGQGSMWPVADAPGPSSDVIGLTRLGPAVVATYFGGGVSAYEVNTGALLPWSPRAYGSILTVAAAPEGAVVGGNFNGIDGVVRHGLASFDLDTGQVEAWTTTLPESVRLEHLVSDGTFLFGATSTGQFFKIDPLSGAVVGSLDFGSDVHSVIERLAGGRIVVVAGQSQLGVITTADWSRQSMPLTLGGFAANVVHELEVVGDTAYIAGTFGTANGVDRPFLAAVDLVTGTVLPFDASPDAEVAGVRFANGRLWVSGSFRRIGGARRRGLAELDPITGRALAWNPDAPGGAGLDVGSAGTLFVAPSTAVSGRNRGRLTAFSPSTGTWVPWRPDVGDARLFVEEQPLSRRAAFLPDCLMLMDDTVACYPSALPSPTAPAVRQDGSVVTFSWTLPAQPPVWTGVRVDVGRREGTSELASFELAGDATSFSGPVPPGSYFARVRTIGPTTTSLPTPDVSFAVGPPEGPAPPLDPTAVSEGTMLTFRWQPPSTGVPAGYVLEAGIAEGVSDVTLPLSGGATSLTIDAPPGRYWGRVRALDAAGASAPSSELILDVDATASPCYASPPLAPLNLTASVLGRSVTLSWTQPDSGPVPNTQAVVAGTAPGLADLGAIEVGGAATSFATTAPPGTYYVRLLALNSCGASPYSNEVQVVVP